MFKNIIQKEFLFMACSQICFGTLGALLIMLLFWHHLVPTIATVNITALEDSFIKETMRQSLSELEMKQKVSLFANNLNQSILKLSKENNLIIMPVEAIIAGNKDYTNQVAMDVKKGLTK